jgi:5-methylthioadenosine/S-adenosylhomocysteine deaminase
VLSLTAGTGAQRAPRQGLVAVAIVVWAAGLVGDRRGQSAPGEIGSLEVGRRADLVILNPDDLHSMAAESVDLHTRIVFGSDRTNVESVYVDGRAIYDRGAFPGFDLDEVRSRAREELKLLLKRREAE